MGTSFKSLFYGAILGVLTLVPMGMSVSAEEITPLTMEEQAAVSEPDKAQTAYYSYWYNRRGYHYRYYYFPRYHHYNYHYWWR